MFPGAIPGSRVVSADDHLTVHHAFQTEAGGRVRHPHLSDPALQFKALRKAVGAAFEAGEAPLWNPSIWTGAPLLGDSQSMVGSPVTWLHILLPRDTGPDAAVVWLLLWIGLGGALLARELGCGAWGSATAGAASMTAPFLSVWLLHPHAATLVWLPWLLLGLERRSRLGTALATAGLLMGGHPETAAHIGLIALTILIFRHRWWAGLVWMTLGLGLAAPIWLPFFEEVLRSATLAAHGGNTLAVAQLLDLVWPGFHGHPATETWNQNGWSWADGRLHPGMAALGLALFAVCKGRGRWLAALWAIAVLVSVTGMPGPLNHARFASLAASLVAIAAGLGVRERWGPIALVAVMASGIWGGWHDQSSLPLSEHDPSPAPWTTQLNDHVDDGRVIGLGWALQPNTGALVGLQDLRGYDLPVSVDTERLQMMLNPRPIRPWFRIDDAPPERLLRFASVRAILSPEALTPALDLGPSPIFARAIIDPSPRAWKATAPRAAATPGAAVQMVLKGDDPSHHPPVEGLSGSWPKQGRLIAASKMRIGLNEVQFDVTGDQPGIAVLSDSWHPGWSVTVDDQPAKALRVGGVFRGVAVSSGQHTIHWKFIPWGWQTGKRILAICIFILLTSLITPIVRRKYAKTSAG